MKPIIQKSIIATTLVVGAGLWVATAKSLELSTKLDYTPNVLTIKGSPYGKVLALAMQGPIDSYWHYGQTHEHVDILNAEDGSEAHDHGHDHDHSHDHDNYNSESEKLSEEASLVWNVRAKEKIRKMSAYTYRVTNRMGKSKAHVDYLKGATEDKIKFAYDLDSTNYANYNNYHLFLTITDFGSSPADSEKAYDMSVSTLMLCKSDNYDPNVWITAASAAYNIIFYMGENPDKFARVELDSALFELDNCLKRFIELYNDAIDRNVISSARINELASYYQSVAKLRESYGVYMSKLANNN